MGTLTAPLFSDMDFLGEKTGALVFAFYLCPVFPQAAAEHGLTLQQGGRLGGPAGHPPPSRIPSPASSDCSSSVCHTPTAADPRTPYAPCGTGAVPHPPPAGTRSLTGFSKACIISSE